MTTAFRSQQTALIAALEAAPGLAGVGVYANRTRALPREIERAVLVRLERSDDDDGPLSCRNWATTFEVEAVARAASGSDPAEAVDPLLEAVWAALGALDASAMPDALDITANPQIEWVFDAAETPLASALVRVTVRHRTQANTLTPWSA